MTTNVDLKGGFSIFVSYSHRADEAAHQLIQALLEKEFVENDDNAMEAAEDQTILAAAFKGVVDAWRERKQSSRHWRPLEPIQVMRAGSVAIWRYLQNLEDAKWDALTDAANDEVAVLSLLCNPYDAVLEDDNEDPPVDHRRPHR